ncbi:hypothetical protein [Bordetella sp. LUAb4]|uniref:hypothetical protein n=1 Tax=Bordetella sp. LUAb4 TaxID=2843195 RepID=UPI001E4E31A8|nr:hypothetical protein [Bordetella sp. LUAb4]
MATRKTNFRADPDNDNDAQDNEEEFYEDDAVGIVDPLDTAGISDAASGMPPGHGNRSLGPGDSSDSGSDLGPDAPDTDTDSVGTGERSDVENDQGDFPARDIGMDRIVDDDGAGLSHTRPNPVRNGG